MWGIAWYLGTTAATLLLLVARFGTLFTLPEYLAISIPIGAVVPAWLVYIVACLTSVLGCVLAHFSSLARAFAARAHHAPPAHPPSRAGRRRSSAPPPSSRTSCTRTGPASRPRCPSW